VAIGVYLDLLTVNAPVRTFTQNLWTWICLLYTSRCV